MPADSDRIAHCKNLEPLFNGSEEDIDHLFSWGREPIGKGPFAVWDDRKCGPMHASRGIQIDYFINEQYSSSKEESAT